MQNRLIIVDAHVHLYDCFDIELLLDSAFSNFQEEADQPKAGLPFSGVLFLAETKTKDWFHHQCQQAITEPFRGGRAGRWSFQLTKEGLSLFARLSEQKELYIIAGRQIRTAENLEVLALGTIQNFEFGTPLEDLIQKISRSGAIPVIPWGVGKWLGRRGILVKDLLKNNNIPLFFLGDNGNRPLFWPKPRLFKQAEESGLCVLPGSDPLPFPSEIKSVGRFGFKLFGSIDPEYPFRDIKKLLLNPTAKPQAYGSLESPGRFFWNQVRMKWLKKGRQAIKS